MNPWLAFVAVGSLTYATRLSFIVIFGRRKISPRVKRALQFVPAAVLSAIIFPELLLPEGFLDISIGNDRLIAGMIAIAAAWFSRNVVVTIIAGMIALILSQAILP